MKIFTRKSHFSIEQIVSLNAYEDRAVHEEQIQNHYEETIEMKENIVVDEDVLLSTILENKICKFSFEIKTRAKQYI